jgi:hypothetical protein
MTAKIEPITDEEREELLKIARRKGLTEDQAIADALRKYIEEYSL